jgi:carboxylesterase type B
MGDYWVQFARSGDPNLPSWPEWPAFTEANRRQIRLGLGSDLGATDEDDWAKLELLREYQLRLIEQMKQLRQSELAAMPV